MCVLIMTNMFKVTDGYYVAMDCKALSCDLDILSKLFKIMPPTELTMGWGRFLGEPNLYAPNLIQPILTNRQATRSYFTFDL